MSRTDDDPTPAEPDAPGTDDAGEVADGDRSDELAPADPDAADAPDAPGRRGAARAALVRRLRTPAGVLTAGVVVTVIGAWLPWSSDGPVRLGGLEGSHDGWLAVLAALAALMTLGSLARRSWPGILVAAVCAGATLTFVLGDAPPPDSSRTWGWWLALGGGIAMATAVVTAAALRLRETRSERWFASTSSAPRTALGIVAIGGALFVWLLLLQILFVTEDRSWPPPSDAVSAADAEAATEAIVAGSLRPRELDIDYAWSAAATVEPWPEGAEFYPRIFDDIRNAESSIHILMFGWDANEVGSELAAILHDKLAEGVEVRVVVDDQGSDPDDAAKEMYGPLVASGAEVVSNDTIQLDFDGRFVDRELDWRQDEFGRAEHRKLYVIDGVVAWTGGAGIQDHFLDGRFHDVMVRVTGDVVRQAQAVFLTSFRAHGAALPDELAPYFPEQPDAGTLPTALVQVIPGGYVSATQAMREMIDTAEQRIDVMNPYLTDTDVVGRLVAAAERGVRVRVVVSETSNNRFAEAALSHHYRRLFDAGVEIWEYPGAVVHAKVLVADDQVMFGTVNLDAWALYRDFELAFLVDDRATVELFEARLLEPDIARSRRPEPPSGVRDRVGAWVWDKLGYFL